MAQTIVMPKLGLTMERATVLNWKKRTGDTVEKGEVVVEVETDKIVNEVESPCSGTLLKILVKEGAEVEVRAALAVVGEPYEDISSLEAAVANSAAGKVAHKGPESTATTTEATEGTEQAAELSQNQAGSASRRRITPRAKKLLAEHGLTLDNLRGMQKERISEADVRGYLEKRGIAGLLKPLTPVQRVVASRMTESFRDIPQFSLRFFVAMDHLLALMVGFQKQTSDKVTINHLLLRATSLTLSRFPDVQRQFHPEGLFQPEEVNLGVAVAAGADLLVPVIRNADRKRIVEISREATELAEKAKTRSLLPDQMQGGTFTVTNLGMYGIASFTPILNPGEGGILGIGAVTEAPRFREGTLEMSKVVEITLVCDHRSVNGVIAAVFCKTFKEIVQNEDVESW